MTENELDKQIELIKKQVEKKITAFKKTLKTDEIATSVSAFNPKKTKLIECHANFRYNQVTDLGTLEVINGSANFGDVENLGNLTTIYGEADFRDSKIKNLGNLKIISSHADFKEIQVKNLGNLTTILGTADFEFSKIKDLGNLTFIGVNAYFKGSKVKDLGKLKTIGWDANFGDSIVENLANLTTIVGAANFSDTKITNLGNLSYVGNDIYANGNKLTKEQIELHLKMMKEINIIKKGLYYISNGKVFINRNDADYKNFFIRDLKFNDNGTIAMK